MSETRTPYQLDSELIAKHTAGAPVFIGIDPSLRATGIAALGPEGNQPLLLRTLAASACTADLRGRFQRYADIVGRVYEHILALACAGNSENIVIAVEGYSFRSAGSSSAALVEFGALLRHPLMSAGWSVVEVPPATVKKFACGRGNGDKVAVATAIAKQWSIFCTSSDEADAYGLAHIARALMKPAAYSAQQLAALASARKGLV